MKTLYDLKPRFAAFLRPAARAISAVGGTANQVTLAAAVLSIVSGALITLFAPRHAGLFLLLPPVLLLRMALNALDGVMAREFGQASTLGAQLNELGDVVSDLALVMPFALLPTSSPWSVASFALAAVLTELAGVLGAAQGGRRAYDGPFGKSDRALALSVLALAVGGGLRLPLDWIFVAMTALSLLTVQARVRSNINAMIETKGR